MKTDFLGKEMAAIRWNSKRRNICILGVLMAVVVLVWLRFGGTMSLPLVRDGTSSPSCCYSVWPPFFPSPRLSQTAFASRCLGHNRPITIETLAENVELWAKSPHPDCRELFVKFSSVYTVVKQRAPVKYPGPFQQKVLRWLGYDAQLLAQALHQNVVHVINKLTREHTVFNPIREKRPMSKPAEPEREYVERLARESEKTCDFCNFTANTAEDVFGRLETKLSFTASNAFKLGTWHGLFMPKAHHPLQWTKAQFMDLMDISLMWVKRAHREDQQAQYPTFVWDMLPHAGASQIHPHLHGLLDSLQYQGSQEGV